jgi:hypothetical protein
MDTAPDINTTRSIASGFDDHSWLPLTIRFPSLYLISFSRVELPLSLLPEPVLFQLYHPPFLCEVDKGERV